MKACRYFFQTRLGRAGSGIGHREVSSMDRSHFRPATDSIETLRDVVLLVPTTFTAASQLARTLERHQLSREPKWDACTVVQYAQSHPSLFDLQTVGSVVTIRRRPRALESLAAEAESNTQAGSSSLPYATSESELPATSLSDADVAMLLDVFPTFCVPLMAFLSSPHDASSRETTVARIAQYRPHLCLRYPRSAAPQSNKEDLETIPWDTAFISLTAQFVQQYVRSGAATSADARWEAWRVEEYEWLRVARLFPTTRAPVPLTADLVTATHPLLPHDRDLLHVLFSAPTLFEVYSTPHSLTSSPVAAAECDAAHGHPPVLSAHFKLAPDPSCASTQGTVEEMQAELARLQSQRFEKGVRVHRRALQRHLTYLLEPTPLLDERVLAQYVFDLLPVDGGVAVKNLLGHLPDAVRNCLPPHLDTLWQREDLFFVFYSDVEMTVQRADAPRPTPRPAESVDALEILQEVYRLYPLARHPDQGTCLFRLLPKLPNVVRDRLFQLRDVETLILRRFPEKVSVLGTDTPLMEQQLKTCRGRTDFFVSFRFVGDWHTRLVTRFEASHEKRIRRARGRPPG